MVKIPQTLKSLTLCTTLAIAASVNGTHPAQAAGIPLSSIEGGFTGTVTYGGTFSTYSTPQKWTFSEGTSNITTPPIIAIKGQSTYTFPEQDPQVLVTGQLEPSEYRGISEGQRDIVPSYTIEALNSRGERVTAKINNEHQTITLPITKAGNLKTYIGELTLAVAEARMMVVDFSKYRIYPSGSDQFAVINIYDDMRGTAGASATGCAFPATGGGPAGLNPVVKSQNFVDKYLYNYVKTSQAAKDYVTLKAGVDFDKVSSTAINQLSTSDNNNYYRYSSADDFQGTAFSPSVTFSVVAVRSGCTPPSMFFGPVYNAIDQILEKKFPGGYLDIPSLDKTATGLTPLNILTKDLYVDVGPFGKATVYIHPNRVRVYGSYTVVVQPEFVTYEAGQEPVDWTATLTIVVAPL